MLQSEDIGVRIHEWATDHFPLAKERNIGRSDSLLESGIVDSLGTLDIVTFLEQEFGFIVEDQEMLADNFESVDSIARFVKSKLAD